MLDVKLTVILFITLNYCMWTSTAFSKRACGTYSTIVYRFQRTSTHSQLNDVKLTDRNGDISDKKFLIVGLGNPGDEYAYTRHNMGFLCLDKFASQWETKLKYAPKFTAEYGACLISGRSVGLLKPMSYMNLSGGPVKQIVKHFELTPSTSNLLVVYDDVKVQWGELRLREGGSPRGHNGLKDIDRALGSREYSRLALGIGTNNRVSMSEHVLGSFRPAEEERLDDMLHQAVDMMKCWVE
mmetsp:Transcript_36955/g.37605  ORF Transcript_36955/g.37605 Transcript_36955/m.37605 type:complete len:240 (-) Transcript_36955:113-832(-)